MNSLLIKNVDVLTLDERFTEYKNGYVAVRGDKIESIGSKTPENEAEFDAVIDGRGGILLPGFVNTHCHASMIPFRTMGDDCADRLRRFLFPLENEAMTPKLVYLGAKYAIAEMLLSGITTFCDMYYFENEVARAASEIGIRGYLGETLIGQSTCVSAEPYGAFDYQREFLEEHKSGRIRAVIAPHGTTTCDADSLKKAHELAVKYDTLFTLHASEMDYELEYFKKQKTTPTKYLAGLGLLDKHLLAAHCIHMTDGDIELLADSGAAVSHCIGSNTKAGKGVAPVKKMLEKGIAVGLGTDGPSSGNTLSMFDQMRLFACFHKTENRDRTLFPARDIVRLATSGGAGALRGQGEYGMLKAGMQADMALISVDAANMFPVYNPYSALVYSANASNVDTVIAAGRVLVRGGALTEISLPEIRAELYGAMGPFMAAASRYSDMI